MPLPDDNVFEDDEEKVKDDKVEEPESVDNDSPQVCAACGVMEGETHKSSPQCPCPSGKFEVHR